MYDLCYNEQMDACPFFFDESNFIPYASFVINRPRFTRWKVIERTIEDHELVLIADGEGLLRIADEVHPLKKGTLLYLHYDEWHSMEASPGTSINFYSVHFSWMLATHTHENWRYDGDINYYLKNTKPGGQEWSFTVDPGLLPFPSTMELSNYEKIEDIFIRLHETYHGKQLGYGMMLSILCQELVHEVCRECFFPRDHKLNLKRLDKAIEYIEVNFMNTIRIEELCNCVNLNESNMIKLFKNNLGRTPVEYINQVRINRAKELLLHTDGAIKEIAYQTGFTDEFYFSRVFKKMEGRSPRGFRQQLLS